MIANPRMTFAWHFAKCPGQKHKTFHSHCIRSYDIEWIAGMRRVITGLYAYLPLPEAHLRLIELEVRVTELLQERKSLQSDIEQGRA